MKLVLFDIDGTLVWADGAGREALSRSLIEVFGTAGPVDSLPMAGKTDMQIVTELLIAAHLDEETIQAGLPAFSQAMTRHMKQTILERDVRSCVGAQQLTTQLSVHADIVLGLLTGNLQATSAIKLQAAGLDPTHFRVGAYGSDHAERTQLAAIAIERAQQLTGHTFSGKSVIIVGDTPADITCGQHLGVTAIGVATGPYSMDVLRTAGADYVFEDLADTDSILEVIR